MYPVVPMDQMEVLNFEIRNPCCLLPASLVISQRTSLRCVVLNARIHYCSLPLREVHSHLSLHPPNHLFPRLLALNRHLPWPWLQKFIRRSLVRHNTFLRRHLAHPTRGSPWSSARVVSLQFPDAWEIAWSRSLVSRTLLPSLPFS